MEVSRQDILKVAALAKLSLPENQLDLLADKFLKVIGFVEQLNEVDTSGVEEMAHPVDVHSVTRADLNLPSLDRETALANAPKSDGEFFLVPPVLG